MDAEMVFDVWFLSWPAPVLVDVRWYFWIFPYDTSIFSPLYNASIIILNLKNNYIRKVCLYF